NAGSNDLTFFSSFGAGRSIGTGGLTPSAAALVNFADGGPSGLIVMNSGDNRVALLLAGTDGPQVAALLTPGGLASLSDLAIGAIDAHSVDVYLTWEGRDAVSLVTFNLDQGTVETPRSDLV